MTSWPPAWHRLRPLARGVDARTRGRMRPASALLLCALWGPASRAEAEEPPRLSAQLVCPARAGAGRIVCQVTVGAPAGKRLRWADALVVRAPDFALPLRARVLATLPEEGGQAVVIAVPLFADKENTGTLEVRVRAVVCPNESSSSCSTLVRVVSAAVAVTREPR